MHTDSLLISLPAPPRLGQRREITKRARPGLLACEAYLLLLDAETARLLSRPGTFDGVRHSGWSPAETAYFWWLEDELKRLGEHAPHGRCFCPEIAAREVA